MKTADKRSKWNMAKLLPKITELKKKAYIMEYLEDVRSDIKS